MRARGLRRGETEAERRLRSALRGRRLTGFKFVRQTPIGSFFADFACRTRRLLIEVDGATQSTEEERRYDLPREMELQRLGYRVLRVGNNDVYENIQGVLETILAELAR